MSDDLYYYERQYELECAGDQGVEEGRTEMASEAIAQALRLTEQYTKEEKCAIIVDAFYAWTGRDQEYWSREDKEASAELVAQLMTAADAIRGDFAAGVKP